MTSLNLRPRLPFRNVINVLAILVAGVLFTGTILHAQQPVVFVHGLNSNGATWNEAAARLTQELDVQVFQPTQSWWAAFQQQGAELQNNPDIGGLPAATIAFGHSNGGVVAREWSKLHPLTGLATIGTPHQGTPIVNHMYDWTLFVDNSRYYDNGLVASFDSSWHNQHLHWVLNALLGNGLGWARWFRSYAAYEALAAAGLDPSLPVFSQMSVPSLYLATLNSDENLSREQTIPYRVGVLNLPRNFWLGGPLRLLVQPQNADSAGVALHAAAAALFYFGSYVQSNADLDDPFGWLDANEKSNWMIQLGEWINEIDLTWCSLVSSPGRANGSACLPNDSLVSWESQVYPGATTVGFEGAAHTYETRRSGDAIYWVLHYIMGVPPRAPAPPPPPPVGDDVLGPFMWLYHDQWRTSNNGRFTLYYQADGNLVIYRDDGVPIWASGTDGTSLGNVTMQGDGNLVITDGEGTPIWSSDTWGNEGAYLIMQGDGNLVIYRPGWVPIWASGTDGY
jgi:pimeloyl-ACP methyl ester carboxylesterase